MIVVSLRRKIVKRNPVKGVTTDNMVQMERAGDVRQWLRKKEANLRRCAKI